MPAEISEFTNLPDPVIIDNIIAHVNLHVTFSLRAAPPSRDLFSTDRVLQETGHFNAEQGP